MTPFFEQLQNHLTEAQKRTTATALSTASLKAGFRPDLSIEETYQRFAYRDLLSVVADDDPLGPSGARFPNRKVVRFGDGPNAVFDTAKILDVRVYIQGIDVTPYLRPEMSKSNNTLDGINTVTLVVDNAENRFVWTEKNLARFYGRTNPVAVESQRRLNQGNLDPTAQVRLERAVANLTTSRFGANEDVKRLMFEYKADATRNPVIRNAKNNVMFARYDLAPNRAIFSKLDPVRVFVLYPFRVPDGSTEELWMPEFTGFVSRCPGEDDNLTGASTISIECSCWMQEVLQRMRISFDPARGTLNPLDSFGFAAPTDTDQTGDGITPTGTNNNPVLENSQNLFENLTDRFFTLENSQFYDDIVGSAYNQPFPNLPMEEAVKQLLVFNQARFTENKAGRGVRNVEYGGTFIYDADSADRAASRQFLEDWHSFTLFGPKRRPWTRAEMEAVGVGTTTDGPWSPYSLRLWFLLPKDGSGPRNVADLSSVEISQTHEVNWTTRAEVLRNLVNSIDYRGFITPYGDLVIEPPFADFRPEDFGQYAEVLRVDGGLMSTSFCDEANDPIGAFILTSGFAQGRGDTGSPISDFTEIKTLAVAPYVIGRYGVTVETDSTPFLMAQDRKVAQQRAVVELQKRNARCHEASFSFAHRPFILPNRPVHHIPRSRIGLTVSVDTSYTFAGEPSATVSVGLEHIRLWTGAYRSPETLANLSDEQLAEIAGSAMDIDSLRGIDAYEGVDPIELQVFANVMAGESTPTSARFGWGSVTAPASGVYVLSRANVLGESDEPTQGGEDDHDFGTETDVAVTTPPGGLIKFAANPLSTVVMTSPKGIRTRDGRTKEHNGIDLRASVGTPLRAVDDGEIIAFGNDKSRPKNGYFITLRTKDRYRVQMIHLDASTEALLRARTTRTVKAGEVIGYTGKSGQGNRDPHLHLEVRDPSGKLVDPVPLLPGEVTGKV